MSDIVLKYNSLSKQSKKEVIDFMDFLLSKQKTQKTDFLSDYKNKILQVSQWSNSDLNLFDENQKIFNQWKAQEW